MDPVLYFLWSGLAVFLSLCVFSFVKALNVAKEKRELHKSIVAQFKSNCNMVVENGINRAKDFIELRYSKEIFLANSDIFFQFLFPETKQEKECEKIVSRSIKNELIAWAQKS